MDLNDREMMREMVAESQDHLAAIEPDLLNLENGPQATHGEIVHRIFRAIHSIKGGFSFFNVKNITELAHQMETVLDHLREGRIPVTPDLMEALLLGLDRLKVLLADVERSDEGNIERELEVLLPFCGEPGEAEDTVSSVSQPQAAKAPPMDPGAGEGQDLDPQLVTKLTQEGKHVFRVVLGRDRKMGGLDATLHSWRDFGEILSTRIAAGNTSSPSYHVYFASVLELDFLPAALHVDSKDVIEMRFGEASPPELHSGTGDEAPSGTPAPAKEAPKPLKARKEGASTQTKTAGTALAAMQMAAGGDDMLRVQVRLLNTLMNLAGELVLGRNQLLQALETRLLEHKGMEKILNEVSQESTRAILEQLKSHGISDRTLSKLPKDLQAACRKSLTDGLHLKLSEFASVHRIVQNLNGVVSSLQENIMLTRMQQISVVFNKFPRVVRDLSLKLGKQARLQLVGGEVELDKSIIEALSDPLVHLVRNALDHGLESPEARAAAGKPVEGTVFIRAYHEGGKVNVEIRDDGKGLDIDVLKQKALDKGLMGEEEVAKLTDQEARQLIFHPGFSTAEAVTDVSGRGVGMDVVRTNIDNLGGSIELESNLGEGTRVVLKLPLTLAIIPSLILTAADRRFALPQVGIREIVRIRVGDVTKRIEHIQGQEVLRLRGRLLPLVRLGQVLSLPSSYVDPVTGERKADRRRRWSDRRGVPGRDWTPVPDGSPEAASVPVIVPSGRRSGEDRRRSIRNAVKVVIVQVDRNEYGLVVDNVLDSEEIVVKPLSSLLKACQAYSGCTIMGDGRISMILDPNGLANLARLRFADLEAAKAAAQGPAQEEKSSLLLFTNGADERFAVDLHSVSRIEQRKETEIERVGSEEFLKVGERSIKVRRLHRILPVQQPKMVHDKVFLLLPRHDAEYAILATSVEDIVEEVLRLQQDSVRMPGVRGTTFLGSKMTLVLDLEKLPGEQFTETRAA